MDKSRYPGHNFYYFLREDKKILEIMDRSRPRGLVIMDKSRYPGHNFYYFLREDKKILEIIRARTGRSGFWRSRSCCPARSSSTEETR